MSKRYYSIEDVDSCVHNCEKCNEPVSNPHQVINIYSQKRGNEHDERFFRHRGCSDEIKSWEEYDKDAVKSEETNIKRKNALNQAMAIVKKWCFDAEELGLDHGFDY